MQNSQKIYSSLPIVLPTVSVFQGQMSALLPENSRLPKIPRSSRFFPFPAPPDLKAGIKNAGSAVYALSVPSFFDRETEKCPLLLFKFTFFTFPLDFPKKKCYTEPTVGIRWEVSVVRAAFGVFCISSCVILCFLHPCRRRICAFFGYRLVGVPFWYVGADFLPAGYRLFRLPKRICAFSYPGGFRKPHVPKHTGQNDFATPPGKTAGLLFQ